MNESETKRPPATSPVGIVIALAALAVLLVLLFFQSGPETDVPPDQGPVAMALVDNLMTNGVLVDYDCEKSTAWVSARRLSAYVVLPDPGRPEIRCSIDRWLMW